MSGFGNVVTITVFQRWAPPGLLGRLMGLLLVASSGIFPVSVLMGGAIVHTWALCASEQTWACWVPLTPSPIERRQLAPTRRSARPASQPAAAPNGARRPPAADVEDVLAYMKRTTVKLPDDLDARLPHEAERRGSTVSELTREAIEAHLGGGRGRRKLIAAAAGRSGSHDLSVCIEEILRNEASR